MIRILLYKINLLLLNIYLNFFIISVVDNKLNKKYGYNLLAINNFYFYILSFIN